MDIDLWRVLLSTKIDERFKAGGKCCSVSLSKTNKQIRLDSHTFPGRSKVSNTVFLSILLFQCSN